MAPATRKSKRAAAAASVPKQEEEEPAFIEEPEERAPKKKKEDPDTAPAETERINTAEQSLGEPSDAFIESHAHPQGNNTEENPQGGDDATAIQVNEEAEGEIAEGNGEEEEEEEVAEGEQEEGDGEDVEDAEQAEEDGDRYRLDVEGLDVEGDVGDDRTGDDEDVEEPSGVKVPDEKQGEEPAVPAQNNGPSSVDGAAKKAIASSREDEAFPSQGKLFIGGLTWETTADTLQTHFGKYGEITDSVVMKNRNTGHPRGFGFVTFADPSVCDKVLKDTHVIDGRTVEAKQTVPREKGPASGKGPKSKKIFIGGLTTTTTEEELKAYFEKFGKVVEHQIMQDHKTGRSRGFGFVTFDSEEVVDNILAQGRLLELSGKQVEIKRAEPKRAGQESFAGSSSSRGRSFAGRGGDFSGGYGAYDPYLARGGGLNSRGGGARAGGPYGDAYRYGGGYSGPYGYGALDDGYGGLGGLGLNYPALGSGPGYGYNLSGSYGGSARGYGGNNVRYHPYGR